MTKLDRDLPISKARGMQFYNLIKDRKKMERWAVVDSMNVSIQMFQREYSSYLQKYPQIKYIKDTKEFVFDP
jgi:hypothetical protein